VRCSIIARCNNKDSWYYKQGIKNFLATKDLEYLWNRDKAYLLQKPSIDRKNGAGNYTRENCRFIELSQNTRQRGNLLDRKSRYEILLGRTWEGMAKEEGISVVTIRQRIRKYGSYKLPPRNQRLPKGYLNQEFISRAKTISSLSKTLKT
jgi:hypothetical protein